MLPKGVQKKFRINNAVYNNIENSGVGGTESHDQELDKNKLLKLAKKNS